MWKKSVMHKISVLDISENLFSGLPIIKVNVIFL